MRLSLSWPEGSRIMFESVYYLTDTSMFLCFQAAFYYYHAASSCHPMAQYRYARCLLCHSPENEWHRLQKAVTFLEQAAVAGLTEVSVHHVGVIIKAERFHRKESSIFRTKSKVLPTYSYHCPCMWTALPACKRQLGAHSVNSAGCLCCRWAF